jgi:hypothetical protein
VVRLLESLCDHERNRLALMIDAIILEHVQAFPRGWVLLIDVGGYASFLSFLIKSSFTTW